MADRDNHQSAPPHLVLRGVHKYLNVVDAPQATNRRMMFIIALLCVAVISQAIGYMFLLPLKERVPYTIKVEADVQGRPTGNVTVSDQSAVPWTPAESNIRYFLARWAESLTSIDERSKDTKLPESYAVMKGQGLSDWNTYVRVQGKPLELLAANPDTRITAEVISISFLSAGSAMIRVKLTDRRGAAKRIQINLTYALIPPVSDEEVYRSPIGLWITSFGVVNELA